MNTIDKYAAGFVAATILQTALLAKLLSNDLMIEFHGTILRNDAVGLVAVRRSSLERCCCLVCGCRLRDGDHCLSPAHRCGELLRTRQAITTTAVIIKRALTAQNPMSCMVVSAVRASGSKLLIISLASFSYRNTICMCSSRSTMMPAAPCRLVTSDIIMTSDVSYG